MRRILLIAICSSVVASQAWAIRVAHYYNGAFSKAGYFGINTSGQGTFASPEWTSVNPSLFQTNTTINVTSMYQSFLSVTSSFPALGNVGGNEWVRVDFVYPTNSTNQASVRRWSQDPRTGGQQVGQTYWANGYTPPGTNSFSWTFTPEWAGTVVQVKATNGTVLGSWGLPAVMSSNYVLSASIVTNQSLLNGAQVWLDGFPASVLAMASTNSNLDSLADRPGYSFEFDSTYQAGEWQARRPDGSIAASGAAASLGTALTGRLTVAEGQSAEIYTRVPAGDGMGATWVPTGVTLQGSSTTVYSFVSNPSPTPAPTPNTTTNAPAPAITNAPTPAPAPGTNSVGTVPAATNDVVVDVDEIDPIPSDDGEQGVLNGMVTAHERLRAILEDARGSFENVALTFNEFRLFALGGVGTNCTFTMGNVTINLGGIVPDFIRTGMKLIILMTAVFAGIKYTWETFR